MSSIGERLKKLRKTKAKKSQKEFGALFDLSESAIGMYERNERKPDYNTLERFADYLETDVNYLITGKVTKHSNDEDFDSFDEFHNTVVKLGLDDLFFHNIEDLKNLTEEDIQELKEDIEYHIRKAKRRKNDTHK